MAGPKQTILVGQKFQTTAFGEIEVVEYLGCNDIKVQFSDGSCVWTNSANVRSGKIRNPFHKTIYGLGYIGLGEYKPSIKQENTREYNAWRNMFARCYSEHELEKQPVRKGSNVSSDWHCFQDFAKWCNSQPSWCTFDGWHLDKDLMIDGNINYGPQVCCFLPPRLNTILRRLDGKTPCVKISEAGNYEVVIRDINGNNTCLGTYKYKAEAEFVYKEERESIVKSLAREYQTYLPEHVFNRLMTWEAPLW